MVATCRWQRIGNADASQKVAFLLPFQPVSTRLKKVLPPS
jgi:hypothetical protein